MSRSTFFLRRWEHSTYGRALVLCGVLVALPHSVHAAPTTWWGDGTKKGIRSILGPCMGCHVKSQFTTEFCDGTCEHYTYDYWDTPTLGAGLFICDDYAPDPYLKLADIRDSTTRVYSSADPTNTYEMPPGGHGFVDWTAGDYAIFDEYMDYPDCSTPPAIGTESLSSYSPTWTDPVDPDTGLPTKAGVRSILSPCMTCHKPITGIENLCFCDKDIVTGLPPWLDFTQREQMGRAAYYTPGLTKIEAIMVRGTDGTMPPDFTYGHSSESFFTYFQMLTIENWIAAGMPN